MTKSIKLEDLLDPVIFKEHETELFDYFQKGGTWKLLFQIDDQVIKEYYEVASHYFHEKKYQEASDLFTYLSILDPYSYDFWMGLAAAKQALNKFEESLLHYTTASAIKPEHPTPHLQLSTCFFAIREVDLAKEELAKTLELSKGHPEYKENYETALLLMQNFPKLR